MASSKDLRDWDYLDELGISKIGQILNFSFIDLTRTEGRKSQTSIYIVPCVFDVIWLLQGQAPTIPVNYYSD